jgi:glycosyltransferase involved in cell wall biosynthesis
MAYSSPDGPIGESLKKDGIKWLPVTRLDISQIKKQVNLFKPDLIHAHDYRASFLSSFIPGIKVISHLHSNWPWSQSWGFKNFLFFLASFRLAKIIVVSNDILIRSPALKLIQFFSPKKIIEAVNCIDVQKVTQSSKEKTAFASFDLTFCGRLTEPKNPELFIEIVAGLVNQGWNGIRAGILGDGEKKEQLARQIQDWGLSKNITLLGFQENPFPVIANSKLLVMTSRWEGFPMAAIEALALGVPVISTSVSGIMTLANNSQSVFVCYSKKDFCEEIKSLLSDNEKRVKMAEASKDWVCNHLNISNYSAKISEIYKSLM